MPCCQLPPCLPDVFVLLLEFLLLQFCFLSHYFDAQMFNLSVSADPFETMLKSLLRYHSGVASVSENHTRKKLYESGVTNSLRSNFALLLKVR